MDAGDRYWRVADVHGRQDVAQSGHSKKRRNINDRGQLAAQFIGPKAQLVDHYNQQ